MQHIRSTTNGILVEAAPKLMGRKSLIYGCKNTKGHFPQGGALGQTLCFSVFVLFVVSYDNNTELQRLALLGTLF